MLAEKFGDTWTRKTVVTVIDLDHVNIVCSPELEEETRHFYSEVLGLEQIPKPASQRPSGAWFQIGSQQVHLSVEPVSRDSQLASGRHVCFRVSDLGVMQDRLTKAGAPIDVDQRPLEGIRRFFTRDPAGNRVELSERLV